MHSSRRAFPLIVLLFALIAVLPSPAHAQLVIDTVAGGGSEDGIAAAGSHVAVSAAAACSDGSIYLATTARLYRVTTDGILHLYAGTGITGFSGDGGPALVTHTAALLEVGVASNGVTLRVSDD